MKTIKVGVIGLGSISSYHTQHYAEHPQAELYALCDINEARAQAAGAKYGVSRVYTDYLEMLADPALEAVSVCTWNDSHAELTIAALEAGKHVLVEKPLCKSVEEAERIEAAVRRTGKLVQIGYVRRFTSKVRTLRSFVDAGDLGGIYTAKASTLRRIGNPGGWFADAERAGGGPLIDLGVHIIDVLWYLMGKPRAASVSGNVYRKLGNRANIRNLSYYKAADFDPSVNTVEDYANALIRFENGASLYVDVSFSLHAKQDETSIRLYGDKGGAEIEPELVIATERHDTLLNLTPQIDALRGYGPQIDHFLDCCLNGKETLCPVEDGVEMMKMLCGIYESARTGRELRL
ncbi:Gfo/Idh/MocA family protein [Paenibacillus cymbidii]|uniref:Gfo/Idh/MocA family protein n=1 Tax=Paenibacillus cymbidii TaxID=1639034 RepID=UPI00108130B1|nr:Gfo/Idh/MocA family oxidoreductase [Paenibacillus cymbidii]